MVKTKNRWWSSRQKKLSRLPGNHYRPASAGQNFRPKKVLCEIYFQPNLTLRLPTWLGWRAKSFGSWKDEKWPLLRLFGDWSRIFGQKGALLQKAVVAVVVVGGDVGAGRRICAAIHVKRRRRRWTWPRRPWTCKKKEGMHCEETVLNLKRTHSLHLCLSGNTVHVNFPSNVVQHRGSEFDIWRVGIARSRMRASIKQNRDEIPT